MTNPQYPAPNLDGVIQYVSQAQMTASQINALALSLSQSGGGTVVFPPGTYSPGGPIQLYPNIVYVGGGWNLVYTAGPDIAPSGFASNGTVLQGDGTFNCFQANQTALGSAFASSLLFSQAGVANCGVQNIGLYNFLGGIQTGALYNAGSFYSYFFNVCALNCGTGFWFENCIHNRYDKLYAFNCTKIHILFRSSCTSAVNQPGNSNAGELCAFASSSLYTSRGIVVDTYNGTGGGLFHVDMLQSCRFNQAANTQAATMSNASTSIGVTDCSRFAPFMPVSFTSTANGFTQNQIYFVQTVSASSGAGNITVANNPYGSAIAATGNTAITINTQGMACLEVINADGNSSNYPALATISSLDLESGGTCKCVANSMSGAIDWAATLVQNSGSTQDIVLRNMGGANGQITCSWNSNIDADSTAYYVMLNMLAGFGANSTRDSNGGGGAGGLIGLQSSLGFGLNLAYQIPFETYSFQNIHTGTGRDFTYCGVSIGQLTAGNDTASLSITSTQSGWQVYNGSATTWTLPTPSAIYLGIEVGVIVSNSATGALTLSAGSPGFNGVGTRTSITINPGASLGCKCVKTAGGTYFWAVTAIGGTYSAGTISTV